MRSAQDIARREGFYLDRTRTDGGDYFLRDGDTVVAHIFKSTKAGWKVWTYEKCSLSFATDSSGNHYCGTFPTLRLAVGHVSRSLNGGPTPRNLSVLP